jgi:REP element-mobilizing transposase RayT
MPRARRQDFPGAVHHVWAKGIDGHPILQDDADCEDLLARLARILPESGMLCFASALMWNHLHLVVRTGPVPLSTVMKRLHTGFALRFNRRTGRCGYLFQGRFGSRVVKDDDDLRTVIAYVLRNPLEAGLARDLAGLERYRWSSYGALIGHRAPYAFEAVAATLAIFGGSREAALERLAEWILREPARQPNPPTLEDLVRDACRRYAIAEAELRSARRTAVAVEARMDICRRAVLELGLRASDVAKALGLTRGAVSQMLRRPRS